jgi:hypothetical protein
MGFDLRQLNPLDYFREFGLFPRVVFLFGSVILLIGLFQQMSVRNPVIFAGSTLVLTALTFHYFSHPTWHEPHPPYKAHLYFRSLLSGTACAALNLLSFTWLLQVGLGEKAPSWVKVLWQRWASWFWSL